MGDIYGLHHSSRDNSLCKKRCLGGGLQNQRKGDECITILMDGVDGERDRKSVRIKDAAETAYR